MKALCLGVFIGIASLYFALREVDWLLLGESFVAIQIGPLILCISVVGIGILLRGARWSIVVGCSTRQVFTFSRAVNLGVLGNQIFPGRLGEVVRVIALKKLSDVGFSEIVAAALLDRIVDVIVLVFSAWLVSALMVRHVLPQAWFFGLGIALVLVVVGLLVARTRRFHAWLANWSERYLHRWAIRPDSFLRVFNAMVGRLSHWRTGTSVVAVALLVWFADYLAVTAALWSIGLDLSPSAPLLLWVMLAASSAIPSAPGYVGIYQLAAVLALATYGIPAHEAIAVSLVLQVVTLLVSLVGAGGEVGLLWSATSRYSKDNDA